MSLSSIANKSASDRQLLLQVVAANQESEAAAEQIRTPYQLHHSRRDPLPLAQDEALAAILEANGVPYELHVDEYDYPGVPTGEIHRKTSFDPGMLELVRAWYARWGVLP